MCIIKFLSERTASIVAAVGMGLYLLLHSMSAQATLVSYSMDYLDPHLFRGDTLFYATIFIDDSDYTGVGVELVTLQSLDMTYNSATWSGGLDVFRHYDNTATGLVGFPTSSTAVYDPFYAEFVNGTFAGYIRGVQPGALDALGIVHLSFGTDSHGYTSNLFFYGLNRHFSHNPGGSAVVGPPLVTGPPPAVPIPAAVWLFGTALIGFVGMSRRTKVA